MARTPREFVTTLKQLKVWAGLTYRQLERRATAQGGELPRSTLAGVFGRNALPRENIVVAVVRACGCDPAPWVAARRRLAMAATDATNESPIRSRGHVLDRSLTTIPPSVGRLVGRTSELRRLRELLVDERSAPLVVLEGPAGSGKSALALRAAHDVAGHFPDGQFYFDIDRTVSGAALESMTRTLTESRALAVLDNIPSVGLIEQMLPLSGRGRALVTSPAPTRLQRSAHNIHVGQLSMDQSVALLEDQLAPDRLAAEPDAVRHLVELCDRRPLALQIAALRLASRPAWMVAALTMLLADDRRCLDELCSGGLDMRASLAAGYDALAAAADEDARNAVRALHLLSRSDVADIDVSGATALLGLPVPETERIMERLVDSRLVEGPAPGSYHVPRLMRLFVGERAVMC